MIQKDGRRKLTRPPKSVNMSTPEKRNVIGKAGENSRESGKRSVKSGGEAGIRTGTRVTFRSRSEKDAAIRASISVQHKYHFAEVIGSVIPVKAGVLFHLPWDIESLVGRPIES